jgi:hypothetical protein
MKDDEKTARGPARGGRAPVVRSTAPAGTPSSRGASPFDAVPAVRRVPSDRPMDTLTPPRTVGGQTARLKIPDSDAGQAQAKEPAPASRTVGGTMRLAPAPTIDPPAPDVDWDSKPAPAPAPVAPAPPAAPAPAPVASGPAAKPRVPTPAAQKAAPASGDDDDDDRTDWSSPLPVAVGLVFFAVGSMIGMTIDGRMRAGGVAPPPAITATASAEPTAAAPVKTAPAPVATASATASVAPVVTATARPTAPVPHGTGASSGPGKRPGKPGLPF